MSRPTFRRFRKLGVWLMGLALAAGPVHAGDFSSRADRVEQLLAEARAVESSDPSRAIALRQAAQTEFQRLRVIVDDVDRDVALYRRQLDQAGRDSYWGALWATLEGSAHSALAVDKAVDLSLVLSRADKDPRIRTMLEAKGLAHTAVDVSQDLQAGDTGAALTRIVREHGGTEAKMGLGVFETLRRAEEGDLTGAVAEAGEVGAAAVEHFDGDSTALRAFSTLLDLRQEVEDAAGSFDAAGDFVETGSSLRAAGERMSEGFEEDNARRRDALSNVARNYPEVFDPSRSEVDPEDLDAMLQLLSGMGLGTEGVNASAPVTPLPDADPELEAGVTQDRLDAVTDAVRRDNEDAAWRRTESELRDASIGDLQLDAFERWLESEEEEEIVFDLLALDADDPESGDPESDDEGGTDHCSTGVFQCPNGLPWPQCTHPEKHDCPPLEFRNAVGGDDPEEELP